MQQSHLQFCIHIHGASVTQAHLLTYSRLYKRVLGSIAVLMLATACQTVQTTSGGVVGVDRKQTMVLSSAKMNQMSALAYTDALQKAKGAGNLNVDAALIARVN